MIQTISHAIVGIAVALAIASTIAPIRNGIHDRNWRHVCAGIGMALMVVVYAAAAIYYIK